MDMSRPHEWLSPTMLAEMLDVSLHTVYSWRRTGGGPTAHRIGRHLRFRSDDVERWLAGCRDDHRPGAA